MASGDLGFCPLLGMKPCNGSRCQFWSVEGRNCAIPVLADAAVRWEKPENTVEPPSLVVSWAKDVDAQDDITRLAKGSEIFTTAVFFDAIRNVLVTQTERLKRHYRVERGIEISVPQPIDLDRRFSVGYEVDFWTGEKTQMRRGGMQFFDFGATTSDVYHGVLSAVVAMVDNLIQDAVTSGGHDVHNSG